MSIRELLTMLGINNVGVDKKERLVSNEANSNSQLIEASGNIYLDARNNELALINKVFLNCKFSYWSECILVVV